MRGGGAVESGSDWQLAFVAMSATLGDSAEDAIAALGGPGGHASARARALAKALRSPSRDVRIGELARALADVARGLDAMVLS